MMDIWYTFWLTYRILLDYAMDLFFGLYFKSKKNCLPPVSNKLVLESACSLARKIKNREAKAEEVVGAFIERTKQVHPYINAMVDDRFLDALKEARKIDEDIRNGRITDEDFRQKPFLGVPFTAKESINAKGLRCTLGLLVRKNVRPAEDATAIQLMKNAGAIHIGVTNVPQRNFWAESYNPVYGITNNPYDLTRGPGGSSGGEGSIIAACGSPLGIGTDFAGSIRMPSHRCGIFGHKSSPNIVPNKGFGFATQDTPSIGVGGPMVKYAEDLLPMYKVLAGNNYSKLKLDEYVDVKKVNVFYMTSIKCSRSSLVQKEIRDKVFKVVKHFKEISGRTPTLVDFEDTKYGVELWAYKLKLEKLDLNGDITNRTGRVNVPLEFLKYAFGRSEYPLYTLYNLVDALVPNVDFQWAEKTLSNLKKEILEKLGDNGILILPSDPRPADYRYTTLLRIDLTYTCLWNALELPVTQVPLGLNSKGLPIGVQVVAAPYQDHLQMAVANELEKAFGGYVPPS